MAKQPLLSICIPIYNRQRFLERMLMRFLKEKELFVDVIHLYISDNCSTEDIKGVVDKYESLGLNLEYHRNERNLGMDGNFANCLNHVKGQYFLLLGSDDTPVDDFFSRILPVLRQNDLGVLHLKQNGGGNINEEPVFFDGNNELFIREINYWITFISGNIVSSRFISNVDLKKYDGTFLTQIPVYLEAILNSKRNAVLQGEFFLKESDSANNGGYDIFGVFVSNLFGIYEQYIRKGLISKQTFNEIIKTEYKEMLVKTIVQIVIFRRDTKFKKEESWSILFKYYGGKLYFYTGLIYETMLFVLTKMKKVFRSRTCSIS